MKGLEKITSIRLAEILSQKGVVSTDAITDALYTQDKHGEPFVEVLVSSGHVSEWDLAKVVVENFQLPFLLASNYDISDEAKTKLPKEELFRHRLVPLDAMGNVMTIALPILAPFDVLDRLQRKHEIEFFPYVGLLSENRKVLTEKFPDFLEWEAEEAKRRAETRKAKEKTTAGDGDWMNIFDSGDAAVKKSKGS